MALAAAESARDAYDRVCDELGALDQKRDTVWSVLPRSRASGLPALGAKPEPGAWLVSVVIRTFVLRLP